jgi:hypothetical protein
MKQKMMRLLPMALLAAAMFTAACNQTHPPTDAQIANAIEGKVSADASVPNKRIVVQASNGVVTLSGSVSSDAERSAAAADAAAVPGVRTVVNNLTVAPQQSQTESAVVEVPERPAPAVAPAPTPARKPRVRDSRESKPKPHAGWPERKPQRTEARQRYEEPSPAYSQPEPEPVAQRQPSYPPPQPSAPPAYAPPPPSAAPQPPAQVTIPAGTMLSVRMLDPLDSDSALPGDTFRASLNAPLELDGNIVIPTNSEVTGRVVEAHAAGKFKGAAMLTIELTRLHCNGRSYPLRTNQWSREIQGRGKNTAEKVGGGAALGAIIGALAGGGKGAAIGTLVGAGAGGTAQAVTHAKQVTLDPETLLNFRLEQPVTVHPSSVNQHYAGRQRLE